MSAPTASTAPNGAKRIRGFKALLISEQAFALLKTLQLDAARGGERRIELRDFATALVLEALEIPDICDRTRRRALAVISEKARRDFAARNDTQPPKKES